MARSGALEPEVRMGPRERMIGVGVEALADEELLTLILSPGTRRLPGPALARQLLREAGSLRRLADRRPGELARIHGLGIAKAGRLAAAWEMARRVLLETPDGDAVLDSPQRVAEHCRRLAFDANEAFVALAVNSRNRLVGEWVLARGWESGVNLTPRQVFTVLVKESVGRVVFVHNHPSGDPTPSPEDFRFTNRLLEAARCLEIRVLDHVIVARDGHASLREWPSGSLVFG